MTNPNDPGFGRLNVLVAIEQDSPAIITQLESEMEILCSKLADKANEHSHYMVLNMVKKALDRLPDD